MVVFKVGKCDVFVVIDVVVCGIDVDDVIYVINYMIFDEEKIYLYCVGCMGCVGKIGIVVMFVDWEDLYKWVLINCVLEFGQFELIEIYLLSLYLYEDFDIFQGMKG